MSTKKGIVAVIVFVIGIVLGLCLTIGGALLMFTKDSGNKITAEEFKQKLTEDGCQITNEIKNQEGVNSYIQSNDSSCPYQMVYMEFNSATYQNQFVNNAVNSIQNDTSANSRVNININDYKEVTTTGSTYNVLIVKDDMLVAASTKASEKDRLNQVISNLNIRNKIATEYIAMLVVGIIILVVTGIGTVVYVIMSLVKKEKKV